MKQMKKLLSVLLVLCMIFSLMCTALAAEGETPMQGKIVILHSNDVHGALTGYAKIAGLRDELIKQGAEVVLADAGDFTNGNPYVSLSKGETAVEMMNAAGYDVATLGNHEFDFGYDNLMSLLSKVKFPVICGDVTKDGKDMLPGTIVIEKGGVKIGFFGLETPETYTKVNPGLIQGVKFLEKEALFAKAREMVASLKEQGVDVIVGLCHLGVDEESVGNRSVDLLDAVPGIDIVIDGHSHSVMTPGVKEIVTGKDKDGKDVIAKNDFSDKAIQSTGTQFAYVGEIVIDGATKKIESQKLVPASEIADNSDVLAAAQKIVDEVDAQLGVVFAKSEAELNGVKGDEKTPGNRTAETNMGDLICDAMLWAVLKDTKLTVPDENVVAVTNGGGIRAPIAKGDVTMKDVKSVLPFGNTVAVIYVTGAELLEALEASTMVMPTALGGFPQIAGMKITVNIGMPYDRGEQYPASTYYAPASIVRVTIDEVNGKAFDEKATYAVVTNNFCAAGGDTYYAFKAAKDQFDTSIPLDEALVSFIKEELNGVIGSAYAEPQSRISTKGTLAERELREAIDELASSLPAKDALTDASAKAVSDAIAAANKVYDTGDKAALEKALSDLQAAGRDLAFKPTSFADVKDGDWFKPAADFSQATGLVKGMSEKEFVPYGNMTRAMVVTVLYRMAGSPDVKGLECTFKDLTQDWYKDAVVWASETGVTMGLDAETFAPNKTITRQEMATMILRYDTGTAMPTPDAEKLAEARKELAKVFSDSDVVADWAVESVAQCAAAGVMVGDKAADGQLATFRPLATLNRAECAQVTLNYFHCVIDPLLGEAEAPAEVPAAA